MDSMSTNHQKLEVKEILEEQGACSSVDALIDNVKLKFQCDH